MQEYFLYSIGILAIIATIIFLIQKASSFQILDSNGKETGVPFYAPIPYLLVKQNEAGKLIPEIIYLPNRTKPFYIQKKGIWGNSKLNISISDGWKLTSISSDVENKIGEILDKISLPKLPDKSTKEKESKITPKVLNDSTILESSIKFSYGLYSFTTDDDGIIESVKSLKEYSDFNRTEMQINPIP